ncbi:SKN1/KRE6 family beta-glucan synthesis-associated protein [Halorubrum rubrum]|uniref:SKN1/KRE6 family beta-glucan synthesis-associated protein n=1 Tax=Halorubrum rubrum TaxID=1126240 RepID=A0ABD5QWV8_9EURY|nr:SKN1/KRE6 family beta-glucan synthesis-associated protein [Halorubrum rubrum]
MDDHSHEPDPEKRVTAPMQEFGGREVGIGAAVTLIGLLLAYVLPALVI